MSRHRAPAAHIRRLMLATWLAVAPLGCARPVAQLPTVEAGVLSEGPDEASRWAALEVRSVPWWQALRTRPEADPNEECSAGIGRGCFVIGMFHENDHAIDRARAAYRVACQLGVVPACMNYGTLVGYGRGGAADRPRGMEILGETCEAGSVQACANLAHLLSDDDPATARRLYEAACAAGNLFACSNLAFQLRHEPRPDHARVVALYRRSCEGGYLNACPRLGFMIAQGCTRGEPDCDRDIDEPPSNVWRPDEVALVERECVERGTIEACMALVMFLDRGRGIERDPARGLALSRRACGGGSAWGCNNLANYYQRGEIVARDMARAVELYGRACDGDFMIACHDRAVTIVNGDVSRPRAEGVALLERMCVAGDTNVCVELIGMCALRVDEACVGSD